MFLVELRPGKEELYRSSDELALAIRNGDVDSRSRVYHRATAKWISITLHPQYKAIVAASKEDPARPARRGWGILGGATAAEAPSTDGSVSNGTLHRWRRPMALGLSGLLLMSGIKLAFSGPRPPWAGRARTAAVRLSTMRVEKPAPSGREGAETAEKAEGTEDAKATQSGGEMQLSLVSMGSAQPPVVREMITVLPRAPRLRSRALRNALRAGSAETVDANSVDALVARYDAAHDSAQTRLESGIRVARLGQLFAADRLNPRGGVAETRMSLAGAANFIRVFREQQATIESAYADKLQQGGSRPPRKESPTLELLSGSLMASIDSILGVLDAQAGAYKIRGTAIAFEDPSAGLAYGALRRRIKEQIDAAVSAGGAIAPGPTRLLLQAIGTTTLPRET